mmetsp:Transcript_8324/g.19168  ORF Transcript_8324/g.19168 Transcript_8324/m.19168 type:complete len:272 (+) Transcript_8324:193-1008(+)
MAPEKLLGLLLGLCRAGQAKSCHHQTSGGETRAGACEGSSTANCVGVENQENHEEVQRDAEQVHYRGPNVLRHVLGPHATHGREVDANAELEGEEGTKRHREGRRSDGDQQRATSEHEHGDDKGLNLCNLAQQREHSGANHAARHETREDGSQGQLADTRSGGGLLKSAGPEEHKRIHRALEQRGSQANRQGAPFREQHAERSGEVAETLHLGVAIVLAPRQGNHDGAKNQHDGTNIEGAGEATVFLGSLSNKPSNHGDNTVAEHAEAKQV